MSKPNPNFHTVNQNGTIILHSNHLSHVVEVHINLAKRRFYGIREDNTVIEDNSDCGDDFAQRVMLYNINYHFKTATWGVKYHIKHENKDGRKEGFNTAREAWLYREALIAGGIAER